ncbi:type II secretion system protein GspC [Rheinheimera sp.]|uniref:type II secretion system protein GspC n=1 Tax=Rheinheimera sp. TaxID=1869214 RepID=UPI00307F6893
MNWLASVRPYLAWLSRVPQNRVNTGLTAALLLLGCYLAAQLTWQLWPAPATPGLPLSAAQVRQASAVDIQPLLAAQLFGKAEATPEVVAPAPSDAPKTSLNLKLTGVVAVKGKPEAGSAIIDSQGAEQTYGVSDRIEGTSASLSQVFDDRVLLNVGGRFETLMLDGVEYQQMAQQNQAVESYQALPEPMEGPQLVEVPEDMAAARQEMLQEPMKFFDYVRISPQYRNGKLYGYRVTPGKDPALFERMGLQTNDIAVEINGTPLNDMQQAMVVMRELREATQASIKIERDGQTRDIVFSLSQ